MQPNVMVEIDHGPPIALHQEAKSSLLERPQPQMTESMSAVGASSMSTSTHGPAEHKLEPSIGGISNDERPATILGYGGNILIGRESDMMRTEELGGERTERPQDSYISMTPPRPNDDLSTGDIHKDETIVIGMNKLGSMKDNDWWGQATGPNGVRASPGNDWTSDGVQSGSSCDILPPPARSNGDTTPVSTTRRTGGNIFTGPAWAPRVTVSVPTPLDQRSVLEEKPIAIVGSSCRFFSGCTSSPSELWRLLDESRDLHRVPPDSRFRIDVFYRPNGLYPGRTNIRRAYDPGVFDAGFFCMKSAEAKALDPQQRLLREVCLGAFESAFGGQPFNSRDNVENTITINKGRMVGADKASAYSKSSNSSGLSSSNMVVKHFDGTQSTGPEGTALGFPASTSWAAGSKTSSIDNAADISMDVLMWMIEYNLVSYSATRKVTMNAADSKDR